MGNPRYAEDLAALDDHWRLEAVVSRRTVLIVVGTTAIADLLERPVAELLRDRIDEEGEGQRYHRGIVLTDAGWFANQDLLTNSPFIAIGDKTGNRLTEWLADPQREYADLHQWTMGEGVHGLFRKFRPDCPQVALYGDSAARTRTAVESYMDKPDGLAAFLELSWPGRQPQPD